MNEWLILLLVGFLPTEIFRWLGVFFSRGLDEKSALYQWVKTVATATLAAVVAKLLFFPSGELQNIPLYVRGLAITGGVMAFYFARRSVVVGVIFGQALLFLGSLLL
jgi:branched-subunit amino acid transport protein